MEKSNSGVSISSRLHRPLRVAIEGNIGSGKSTFLEYCRQYTDVEVVKEPVHEWQNVGGVNLLEKFYSNPQQWAVTFQSYVTLSTVENHVQQPSQPIRMTERSIQSSRNCFIETMFENGTIELGMLNVFDRWVHFLITTMSMNLDVIVYIHTSPPIAHERIANRSRPEESGLSLPYLEKLHRLHSEWIGRENDATINGDGNVIVLTLDGDLPLEELKEKYDVCMNHIHSLL